MEMEKGQFIIINGVDGAGKGVQMKLLRDKNPNSVALREPGGTKEAEIIRRVLLDSELSIDERKEELLVLLNSEGINELTRSYVQSAYRVMQESGLDGSAETWLYAASRSESNEKVVKNAIKNGKLILSERSVACSMSYQGYARGLGMKEVWDINQPVIEGYYPTLEIFLDVNPLIAHDRLLARVEKRDRLDKEPKTFHEKTREGYFVYYKEYCPYPYQIIDANGTVDETFARITSALEAYKIRMII